MQMTWKYDQKNNTGELEDSSNFIKMQSAQNKIQASEL